MKWLSLPLALLLLSACDNDKLPPRPEPPATPRVETPADPPEPAVSVIPESDLEEMAGDDSDEPPEIQVELEPIAEGDPKELPSERIATAPPAKPAAPKIKKKVAVEDVEVPEAELDLSLPEDWAEDAEPEQSAASMSLLPPLFEGERARSVQLTGSLLPALDGDDALIDGAQLNFELKR